MSVFDIPRIVFISDHNACRGRLAEAMAKRVFGQTISVQSAGLSPMPVSPLAVKIIREVGLDCSDESAKPISEVNWDNVDVAVFLSESAMQAGAPSRVQALQWFYPPLEGAGPTDEDKLEQLRQIRDGLFQRMGLLALAMSTR